MIRKIKRALGIRFSAKALIRNPAVYLRQTGTGFRGFPQLAVDLFERRTASIVQVGANDGGPNDPLGRLLPRHRERVQKAVLIEPQPDPFERLRKRYVGWDRVVCLNAAVGRSVGNRAMYSVVPDSAAHSAKPVGDGVASFDRQHVERHLRERYRGLSPETLAAMVRTLSVPVTTLDLAAGKAGIERPDIFVVDTEGYDGEVMAMALDLGWRPGLLQWEHKHLSRRERRQLTRRSSGRRIPALGRPCRHLGRPGRRLRQGGDAPIPSAAIPPVFGTPVRSGLNPARRASGRGPRGPGGRSPRRGRHRSPAPRAAPRPIAGR